MIVANLRSSEYYYCGQEIQFLLRMNFQFPEDLVLKAFL